MISERPRPSPAVPSYAGPMGGELPTGRNNLGPLPTAAPPTTRVTRRGSWAPPRPERNTPARPNPRRGAGRERKRERRPSTWTWAAVNGNTTPHCPPCRATNILSPRPTRHTNTFTPQRFFSWVPGATSPCWTKYDARGRHLSRERLEWRATFGPKASLPPLLPGEAAVSGAAMCRLRLTGPQPRPGAGGPAALKQRHPPSWCATKRPPRRQPLTAWNRVRGVANSARAGGAPSRSAAEFRLVYA